MKKSQSGIKKRLPYIILFLVGAFVIAYGMSNVGKVDNSEEVEVALEENAAEPVAEIIEPEEPQIGGIVAELKSGETLSGVLQSYGVSAVETDRAVDEIREVFNMRKLRVGQKIHLDLSVAAVESAAEITQKNIVKLDFQPSITDIVHLELDDKNEFVARIEKVDLDEIYIKASGVIESSFYESMIKAGVTDNVTLQLISALSFVVDFQRDIKSGNEFEVLYQAYVKDGELLKGKVPAYVKLKMKREEVEIFVTENADGSLGYHHADGQNVKKGLLRTPINGARISSRFGNRKHPILGYTRLHAGVDFAAATGTPIYSAGDGTVAFVGRKGGYGNYVKIKHNGTYSTAYAHASRFANGMRVGKHVKQGQVIAYVGTTGRSTGPHLHYEVHKNGRQINPQNAKFNIVSKLTGDALVQFKKHKAVIEEQLKVAKRRSEIGKDEPVELEVLEPLSQEN